MTGGTESTNFPATLGAYDTTFNGNRDMFVAKLNESGSALVYATYFGGSGSDGANGIAVDGSGNTYVTGYIRERKRSRHLLYEGRGLYNISAGREVRL